MRVPDVSLTIGRRAARQLVSALVFCLDSDDELVTIGLGSIHSDEDGDETSLIIRGGGALGLEREDVDVPVREVEVGP